MAEPVYKPCSVCREPTRHTAPGGLTMLCRDTRCRETALGKAAALADTHRYLTEPVFNIDMKAHAQLDAGVIKLSPEAVKQLIPGGLRGGSK